MNSFQHPHKESAINILLPTKDAQNLPSSHSQQVAHPGQRHFSLF